MASRANRARGYLGPVALFLLFSAAFGLLLFFGNQPPRVERLEPSRAEVGAIVAVLGSNFGDERGDSRLILAGQIPTSSRYRSWSDTRIEFEVPQGASSGLLYVVTGSGRSNPILFTNVDSEPLAEGPLEASPMIERVEPVTVAPGDALRIYGENFGRLRADTRLNFSALGGGEVPVDHSSGGYLLWSENLLTVRVPAAAGEGPLRLVSREGTVETRSVSVERTGGTVSYTNPREYAVRQEARFYDFDESRDGLLYVWLPEIQRSGAQRRIQLLNQSHTPAARLLDKAELYELRPPETRSHTEEEPPPPEEIRLVRTFLFQRYEVRAEVEASEIPEEYRLDQSFMRRYTGEEPHLALRSERVQGFARESVGGVSNRVEQANWIYREVIRVLEPDPSGPAVPEDALEEERAASAGYASLMVSALRTVGVPARTVSGIIISEDLNSLPHHWVELFLQGFGWFPADPALADGMFGGEVRGPREETAPEEFYFGNLDGRRIAFSYGTLSTPSMEMESEPRLPESEYARMQTFEESTPEVGDYESDWLVPELIGSY